jgi:hypothetical protein
MVGIPHEWHAKPRDANSCDVAVDPAEHVTETAEKLSAGHHPEVRWAPYVVIAALVGLEFAYIAAGMSQSSMLVRGQ